MRMCAWAGLHTGSVMEVAGSPGLTLVNLSDQVSNELCWAHCQQWLPQAGFSHMLEIL